MLTYEFKSAKIKFVGSKKLKIKQKKQFKNIFFEKKINFLKNMLTTKKKGAKM